MHRRISAALLAAAILTAACSGDPPQSADDRPVPGGNLRVALRETGTLDPSRASWRGSLVVLSQIYDTLTSIDPATGVAVPGVARWEVSRNGLRWRFRLRQTRYTDGRLVTARDFKLAFDRIARKATASDVAFQLENIKGFRDVHDAGTATSLSGVTVRRSDVLDITLERPFAELPYRLAHPRLGPIPAHKFARSAKGLGGAPVTNGPFKVARIAKDTIALARNETYSGSNPLVDAITFRAYGEVERGWRAFSARGVHIAEVPASELATGGSAEQEDAPLWSLVSFAPNLRLSKYQKPEVRRALSLALNREAIARGVYGSTKTPASGLIPRGVRGFAPDACSACAHDRDRARKLLRAAFGSKPPEIIIDYLSDRTSRLLAQAVAADLRAVGLPTKVRAHSASTYLGFLQSGKADLAQSGWIDDVPTPDGFLAQPLLGSSPNNLSGYSDARFDLLIERARMERDESKRLARYRGAEAHALDQMAMIPVVFFRQRIGVADAVRRFRVDGAGVFDGATVWLAKR